MKSRMQSSLQSTVMHFNEAGVFRSTALLFQAGGKLSMRRGMSSR